MKNNRVKLICSICAAISIGCYGVVIAGENQLYSSFREVTLLNTEEVEILRLVVAQFARVFTQPLMFASIIINVASNASLIKKLRSTFAYNVSVCGAVYLIQILTLTSFGAQFYNLDYFLFASITHIVVSFLIGIVVVFCMAKKEDEKDDEAKGPVHPS